MALQAFLSHSSKDKKFIEDVAKRLGEEKVVVDTWDFETAEKILDEVIFNINSSILFVLFISDSALDRDWVQKELEIAKKLIESGRIKKFLPLLIDSKVHYSDERIPKWIRVEYNLKLIVKVGKCYSLINGSLMALAWKLSPKNSKLDQVFIGRNKQMQEFEERIYKIGVPFPVCFIIAGITGVGRKKFLNFALYKIGLIRDYYRPIVITMNTTDSIEELIIKIYDLGFSDVEYSELTNLSATTMQKKIRILANLLSDIRSMSEYLQIVDNGSIVRGDGVLSDWFIDAIVQLDEHNKSVIGLISKVRTQYSELRNMHKIHQIIIPQLEQHERQAFFRKLLEIEDKQLNDQEFMEISDLFLGFPEQISSTVQMIVHRNVRYVLSNKDRVIEYSSIIVANLISSYEKDYLAMQVLKIMSEADFISLYLLEKIFGSEFESVSKVVQQLDSEFILQNIGISGEYFQLNDSISDYVQRLGIKLEDKFQENLTTHIKSVVEGSVPILDDASDFLFSLKEGLKQGIQIPDKYLIPSHYLNAIRELYNYEKKYKDVVELAEKVLVNHATIDESVIHEIRYWMCLALARMRDKRFDYEVRKIHKIEQEFLRGFNFRLSGRFHEAITQLHLVLQSKPWHRRAKRELVHSYLNSQQYEKALELAEENYLQDKRNPYNLQSYIRCLISIFGEDKKDEILLLINELQSNNNPKSEEMYLNSLAYYTSVIEKDSPKSLLQADVAIHAFPKSIYPYLMKLEIAYEQKEINQIKETVHQVNTNFDKESYIFTQLPYVKCKCIVLASEDKVAEINYILKTMIKQKYSPDVYERFRSELEEFTGEDLV